MGYSPGALRRCKPPHCLCQERGALPSSSPAPVQVWQETMETAGLLSAKAEQMFPARSHSCPEQLTTHIAQRKGSQGSSSRALVWRYIGGIICWKQINVCSCSSWPTMSSGSTGLLIVPRDRGHLPSLPGQHLPSLPHWGQFACGALALRDELTLLHRTLWSNHCAHWCLWKEYRGDLQSPHPPGLLAYSRY